MLDRDDLVDLRELQSCLQALDGVASMFSIFDAPLLRCPAMRLAELATGFLTLESEVTDLEFARGELRNSPVFA